MIIMKQMLVNLLLEMLRSYGYQTAPCDFCDIVCRRGDYELFVMCSPERDLSLLDRFADDVHGRNGLFVTMRKFRGNVDTGAYLRDTGVVIWDRDVLAAHVGKFRKAFMKENELDEMIGNWIINDIESRSYRETFLQKGSVVYDGATYDGVMYNDPRETPSAASPSQDVSRAGPLSGRHPVESGRVIIAEDDDGSRLSASSGAGLPTQPYPPQPAAAAQPYPPQPAAAAQPYPPQPAFVQQPVQDFGNVSGQSPISLPSSEIRVGPDSVISAARATIGEVNAVRLKFIPYWKYSYSINVDKMFCGERIRISGNGSGLYNAVNGMRDDMEIGSISVLRSLPTDDYEEKEAKISADEVRQNIVKELSGKYTRDVSSNETNAQVIISQSKVFRPSESDFTIDIKQIYVPVWEARGRKKSIEVNAYSGKPLEVPADDGVEFV